ncbi:TetR/AcrR family transcriptional regulator [Ramlibacter sp. PS3R-8]|uniref:TetR/AcrR family transcriptional regulator n=1 Tax=Ramlibacter sp. PS3R-8 TaxID=3133437 RepID=UPI0030A9D5D5
MAGTNLGKDEHTALAGTWDAPRKVGGGARDALLAAAVAEFAENGFAGARVDAIAQRAGVNKQLVYHYFQNKQGLYQAALEAVYAEIRDRERELSLDALAPAEAMARLVGFSFDYLADHPEFIALLADENRNRGSHLKASPRLKRMHSPLMDLLRRTLRRGVEAGVFHRGYDAVNLYITVAGVSYFYFSNNHTLSAIFGRPLATPAALAGRRRHVVRIVLNALRA